MDASLERSRSVEGGSFGKQAVVCGLVVTQYTWRFGDTIYLRLADVA